MNPNENSSTSENTGNHTVILPDPVESPFFGDASTPQEVSLPTEEPSVPPFLTGRNPAREEQVTRKGAAARLNDTGHCPRVEPLGLEQEVTPVPSPEQEPMVPTPITFSHPYWRLVGVAAMLVFAITVSAKALESRKSNVGLFGVRQNVQQTVTAEKRPSEIPTPEVVIDEESEPESTDDSGSGSYGMTGLEPTYRSPYGNQETGYEEDPYEGDSGYSGKGYGDGWSYEWYTDGNGFSLTDDEITFNYDDNRITYRYNDNEVDIDSEILNMLIEEGWVDSDISWNDFFDRGYGNNVDNDYGYNYDNSRDYGYGYGNGDSYGYNDKYRFDEDYGYNDGYGGRNGRDYDQQYYRWW